MLWLKKEALKAESRAASVEKTMRKLPAAGALCVCPGDGGAWGGRQGVGRSQDLAEMVGTVASVVAGGRVCSPGGSLQLQAQPQ